MPRNTKMNRLAIYKKALELLDAKDWTAINSGLCLLIRCAHDELFPNDYYSLSYLNPYGNKECLDTYPELYKQKPDDGYSVMEMWFVKGDFNLRRPLLVNAIAELEKK